MAENDNNLLDDLDLPNKTVSNYASKLTFGVSILVWFILALLGYFAHLDSGLIESTLLGKCLGFLMFLLAPLGLAFSLLSMFRKEPLSWIKILGNILIWLFTLLVLTSIFLLITAVDGVK